MTLRAAAVLAAAGLPFAGLAYVDGPPPGHTGGFGEPTCHACHFDNPIDGPAGSLTVAGLPDRYAPGRCYRLAVELRQPDLARGGFELAVRFADGRQAGTLFAADRRVGVNDSAGVAYAHHLEAGLAPAAPGLARWVVAWTAPRSNAPVYLHAAANAADGDDSPLGDRVHTLKAVVAGAAGGRPVADQPAAPRSCAANASGPTGAPVARRASSS